MWNRRTGESLQQAIELFKQAVSRDTNYALAYAGLADCYAVLPNYTRLPKQDILPSARVAALKALELDGRLAEPHAALGFINIMDWQWAAADKESKQAIEINPRYATAHHWRSAVFTALAKHQDALMEMLKAQELDPLSPQTQSTLNLALVRQDDRAIQILRIQTATDPSFVYAHAVPAVFIQKERSLQSYRRVRDGAAVAWQWAVLGESLAWLTPAQGGSPTRRILPVPGAPTARVRAPTASRRSAWPGP